MGYRNYGPANGFIVSADGNSDFSTIQAAINAAVAPTTIFIRPGTYVSNLTLKVGVNLAAFGSDDSLNATGTVIISGTLTLTTAGSVSISGIQLQTNSAALLAVTGSAASIVNLNNCYLNCTNNTGITFSSSSASARINIFYCTGDLGTTGIGLFTDSSAGILNIYYSKFTNTGGSSTASTISAGNLRAFQSEFFFPITSSGTGGLIFGYVNVDTSAQNAIGITAEGTGNGSFVFCSATTGTASAISVGTGATFGVFEAYISSSNTNAITGAGTLNYADIVFNGTVKINTTTQVGGLLQGGVNQAPSAGFIGEQIRANGTSVNMPNGVGTNICSISLTAGIWDVSGLSICLYVGGAAIAWLVGIGTVSNTPGSGTNGDSYMQLNGAIAQNAISIPSFRITLTATTTVYLSGLSQFTGGSSAATGRISATRVG